MRLAETSSWRLEVKGGYLIELALFVREAAGLDLAGPAGDLPSLIGAVPDVAGVLDAGVRRDAVDQWRRWWGQILELEFKDRQNDRGHARDRARRRVADHEAVCDPPDFEALADRPALRAAARASFAAFKQWESARPSPARDGVSGSPLDWSVMKQTAEDVAFDCNVDIGAVQASVAVLPVRGIWWHRVSPGCVMCSTDAAGDPVTVQVLLRDAFESQVRPA
ncbi:hypothetical protein [uncultured Jatrophihabitans sp.]|uniref:hypothetical protein n=1 Tax=uncultured Jatrophihabitans sp. TaxID=1610747 RepID=UPI0035CAABFD